MTVPVTGGPPATPVTVALSKMVPPMLVSVEPLVVTVAIPAPSVRIAGLAPATCGAVPPTEAIAFVAGEHIVTTTAAHTPPKAAVLRAAEPPDPIRVRTNPLNPPIAAPVPRTNPSSWMGFRGLWER